MALDDELEGIRRKQAEKEIRDEAARVTLPGLTARRLIRDMAGLNQGDVASFVGGPGSPYSRGSIQLWESSRVEPIGLVKLRYAWLLRKLLIEVLDRERKAFDEMNERFLPLLSQAEPPTEASVTKKG